MCCTSLFSQDVISFQIIGLDDSIKSNREQDYKEALLNAKLKALEMAGIEIKSETKVINYDLIEEIIESKSKEVVLPGMNITEIGYNENGYYQVLIVGEIRREAEGVSHKKLRYALNLYQRLEYKKSESELNEIIKTSNEDELVAEALYLKIKWKFAEDYLEEFEKLRATYPDSKYVEKAKIIIDGFLEKEEERKRQEIADGTVKTNFNISSDLPYENTGYSVLKGSTFIGIGNYQIRNYGNIYIRGCCIGHFSNEYQEIKKELYLDFDKEYEMEVQYYFYNDKSSAYEKNKYIKFRTPAYDEKVKSFLINVKFDKVAGVSFSLEAQYK